MQNLALGEGSDEAVGEDVEEEVGDGEVGRGGGVLGDSGGGEGGGVDVEATAGLDDVGHDHTDSKREGANYLKIKDRFEADATEAVEVSGAGDAEDDGEEDDRRDEHSDEADEAVGEGLHGFAGVRREEAEEDSGGEADEDAEVEGGVERAAGGCGGHVEPAYRILRFKRVGREFNAI